MPSKGCCLLAPLLAVLMLILAGPAAEAGPWPRAPGTKFLSLSVERDRESNSYTGLYAEYGMDARNTLGFELGHTNVGETSAMIWWQRALDDGSGPNRWVVSMGLGGFSRDGHTDPVGQIGAAWGRGFEGFMGGGWMSVETRVKFAASQTKIEEEEEENDNDENTNAPEELSTDSDPLQPLPTFPEADWPKILMLILSYATSPTQRDILLLGALTALGATMERYVRCSYSGKYQSPCLQTFFVAPPASGKSGLSLIRLLVEPIHDKIRQQVDEEMKAYRKEKKNYGKFNDLHEERKNSVQANIQKG